MHHRHYRNDHNRIEIKPGGKMVKKLLENEPLTVDQRESAIKELTRKCTIYGDGCMKHGRRKEGQKYFELCRYYQ